MSAALWVDWLFDIFAALGCSRDILLCPGLCGVVALARLGGGVILDRAPCRPVLRFLVDGDSRVWGRRHGLYALYPRVLFPFLLPPGTVALRRRDSGPGWMHGARGTGSGIGFGPEREGLDLHGVPLVCSAF